MEKKLVLIYPDETSPGQPREFMVGIDGVTNIVRADGGYAVVRGARRTVLPDHRVSAYIEEQRPGATPEPAHLTGGKLGARNPETGLWDCKLCTKPYASFHALRIHHARSHA